VIGETVGNYRIVAELGHGGMGVVYRGEHVQLGRPAAVKMLLPQFSRDPTIVQRFFNEARAASSIDHPGIVEVFDFGTHYDGRAYIIMALLAGESLEHRLQRGPLAPVEGATLIAQVAAALAAAHVRGIVHRDLKPDNIFLTRKDGKELAKLLDFGIAKFLDREGVTKAGMTLGTPHYMAPEQIMKGSQVGTSSDIYALGMVLYEALAGTPAFEGPTIAAILRGHCTEPVEPPSRRRGEALPPVLEAAILKCLEKDPQQRFATADELVDALRADKPVAVSGAWRRGLARRASRQRVVMMMPAFAMAAAALLIQVWPRGGGESRAATPPVVVPAAPVAVAPKVVEPPPAPPPAPVQAKRTIQVELASKPAGAEIFLGETSLGTAPVSVEVELGTDPVTVAARFPNGARVVETFVPDRPHPTIVLVKPAVTAKPAKRPAKPPPAQPSKPTKSGDIMDPFNR